MPLKVSSVRASTIRPMAAEVLFTRRKAGTETVGWGMGSGFATEARTAVFIVVHREYLLLPGPAGVGGQPKRGLRSRGGAGRQTNPGYPDWFLELIDSTAISKPLRFLQNEPNGKLRA